MASKYEKLKARMQSASRRARESTANAIHAAESVGACAVGSFAAARLSDENGEFGFRGVPYLLLAGGIMYVGGIAAGGRYQADMFAVGTGLVNAHVARVAYEYGIKSKEEAGTAGVARTRGALPNQRVGFATGFDSVGQRMAA
jgi:hypothetical protein